VFGQSTDVVSANANANATTVWKLLWAGEKPARKQMGSALDHTRTGDLTELLEYGILIRGDSAAATMVLKLTTSHYKMARGSQLRSMRLRQRINTELWVMSFAKGLDVVKNEGASQLCAWKDGRHPHFSSAGSAEDDSQLGHR
jgi:hypothetical protein